MCIGSGLRGGGGTALVYRSADLARGELRGVFHRQCGRGEGHFDDALEGVATGYIHYLIYLLTPHCIQIQNLFCRLAFRRPSVQLVQPGDGRVLGVVRRGRLAGDEWDSNR